MAKKPPVTSARRRAERASGSKKVAASTPQKRPTTTMQRPFQPGTRTRFENPSKGGSTTKSQTVGSAKTGPKTYQVSDPWAKPTRASIGNVKGPASSPKRPTGPVRASIGNVKGPATSPKTPSTPKGAVKQATKGASALTKAGRFVGRTGAVLTGAELFKQGQSGSELDQLTRAIGGKGSNPNTDIGKRAGDAIKAALTQKSKYGPRFKNPNTGTVASKGAKPKAPMPKNAGAALREKSYASLQKFNVPKPKAAAKPTAPKAASAPSRSSAPGRSTTSARTSSRPAAKPAAKPKASSSSMTESSLSASDIMKGYGMRVNQTFGAESSPTPKKRQSLREQTAEIKQMIAESKKRQGKG